MVPRPNASSSTQPAPTSIAVSRATGLPRPSYQGCTNRQERRASRWLVESRHAGRTMDAMGRPELETQLSYCGFYVAGLSVSHLYNLRASELYRKHRLVCNGTRPAPLAIGVRKAPAPQGLPGYIRIDTVHQGDQDGMKGVYHINAVDIVTQWELVASVEHISET